MKLTYKYMTSLGYTSQARTLMQLHLTTK